MYGRKHVGDIELLAFGEAGELIEPSAPMFSSVIQANAMVPTSQTNIRPVTSAANAAGAPVSYTGDPAVDNATEAGTDVVASGRNMLLWLGIGAAALWVLFAKGRRA